MRRIYYRSTIILSILILTATNSFAEKYYLFINKGIGINKLELRQAGQTEEGDVVTFLKVTPQNEPTQAELDRYQIIIVDMTEEEVISLVQPEKAIVSEETEVLIKSRNKTVDYKKLSKKEQKSEITKSELDSKVSNKLIIASGVIE